MGEILAYQEIPWEANQTLGQLGPGEWINLGKSHSDKNFPHKVGSDFSRCLVIGRCRFLVSIVSIDRHMNITMYDPILYII